MATLEKIRKKSTLLLIIIGVALLSFVLGDLLSRQNIFTNTDTAAKVAGEKIGIQEFQDKYNEMSQRMQGRNVDPAVMQQQVLDQMISLKLLEKEAKELGIQISQAELNEFTTGKYAQNTAQLAQQFGLATPSELLEAINNPAAFMTKMQIPAESQEQVKNALSQAKKQWIEIEESTRQQLMLMKIGRLVAGTITANKLDIAAINQNNTVYSANVVKKSFYEIDDKTISVSDEEIKARYEVEKNRFKVKEDSRRIDFMAVLLRPSAKDEAAATQTMNTTIALLKEPNGVDKVRANSDVVVDHASSTLDKIRQNDLKEFVQSAEPGSVSELKRAGDQYSAFKLISKSVAIDSVNVQMVRVDGKKQLQDSILAVLRSGVAPDSIQNPAVQANPTQWIDLTQLDNDTICAKLRNTDGFIVLDSKEDMGAIIAKVTERRAPKTIYNFATVSYRLEPSDETISDIRMKFQKYVSANGNEADFAKNAAKSGLGTTAIPDMVTQATAQIGGITDSRKAIKWAFEAKPGSVSAIFDTDKDAQGNRYLLAVAVKSEIPKGVAPLEEVKDQIKAMIISDKKAEKLLKQFNDTKANSLEGYSAALKASIDSVSVTFSNPNIPMVGPDAKFAGRVTASKVGALSKPVVGNAGVYVYQVTKVNEQGTKLGDKEAANRYQFSGLRLASSGYGMPMFLQILREASSVHNYLIKFY